ncbi:transcription factor SOX-17-like [Syngnathoides biaculeatus]|uniref:transcription factor SOX-17-like n=1 Tax=Syngnathoides biaculeatus TaxID=300417 RepID=UPI002ADDB1D9|nr:transcription factor SOX-17-like [Syngnathoides biaculeatus]
MPTPAPYTQQIVYLPVDTMEDGEWNSVMEVINADFLRKVKKQKQFVAAPSLANVNHGPPLLILGQTCYRLVPSGVLVPSPSPTTPHPPTPSPLLLPPKSKKIKTMSRPEEGPYIKKPPNAFMIFAKEHRSIVKAQCFNIDSASVNKILGQMWKSLTPAEQHLYFQESDRLSRIHADMYPDWNSRDNYGKKKKRKWGRAATSSNNMTIPVPELAPPPFKPRNEGPGAAPTSILGLADSAWSSPCSDVSLEADPMSALLEQLEDLESVNAAEPPPSFCHTADVEDLERPKHWTPWNIQGPGAAQTSILGLADSACLSSPCSDVGLEADLMSALLEQLEDLESVNAAEPPPSFCHTADVEDLERPKHWTQCNIQGPGAAPTSILGLADSAWSSPCSDVSLEADLMSALFEQLENLEPVNAAEPLPSFCHTADVEDLERLNTGLHGIFKDPEQPRPPFWDWRTRLGRPPTQTWASRRT